MLPASGSGIDLSDQVDAMPFGPITAMPGMPFGSITYPVFHTPGWDTEAIPPVSSLDPPAPRIDLTPIRLDYAKMAEIMGVPWHGKEPRPGCVGAVESRKNT